MDLEKRMRNLINKNRKHRKLEEVEKNYQRQCKYIKFQNYGIGKY